MVGHGVEHGFRGHVRQLLGQGRGELDTAHPEVVREFDPILDGEVRIFLALLTRSQLLESGREHAHLHVFRLELNGHKASPSVPTVDLFSGPR